MPDHTNAAPGSIWRITGHYRHQGTFSDCLAIVLDPALHGTEETVFAMLPPLGWGGGMDDKVISPDQIIAAHLVVADPWADVVPLHLAPDVEIRSEP